MKHKHMRTNERGQVTILIVAFAAITLSVLAMFMIFILPIFASWAGSIPLSGAYVSEAEAFRDGYGGIVLMVGFMMIATLGSLVVYFYYGGNGRRTPRPPQRGL